MSDLKDYPASVFVSGMLAAWALVVLPPAAVFTGSLLGMFALEGLFLIRTFGLGVFFIVVVLLPFTMLFDWMGLAPLAVLVCATIRFLLREDHRAEALLAICLAPLTYYCLCALSSATNHVHFWIRAPLAYAVPIGAYFCIRWLPVIRASRRLAQLDEDEHGIDDDGVHPD